MAYIGTYYFNGSGKELLCQDHSVKAILAKYSVTKTSAGFVAFNTLSTAFTPYLSLSTNKWRREALFKHN